MRVIPSLFLSCFLFGLLVRIGHGQLFNTGSTGESTVSSSQGLLGDLLPGSNIGGTVSNVVDVLSNVLGSVLNSNLNVLGIPVGNIIGNLSNVLNNLQTVPLNSLLRGITSGDVSQLEQILHLVLNPLQELPIVGPLILLLSQILNIPLTLVTSIVALLLQLLTVLLSVTKAASG